MEIIKMIGFVEESRSEAGIAADHPLRKAAAVAVVANPFAGKPFADDLSELVDASPALARLLGETACKLLGDPVESYGKGAIVGLGGEQEHGVALLTTVFGDALREAVGGGAAWISSATKCGNAGTSIDIPLAYKNALFVRSHYDAFSFTLHSAPLPDQIAVICAVANRGRLNHRVGGIARDDAVGKDGLR